MLPDCSREVSCEIKSSVFIEMFFRESSIKSFTYLPPNATFELAMLRISQNSHTEAQTLLDKARAYKSYSLENKLHFRIHSAMGTMGCRTPMM